MRGRSWRWPAALAWGLAGLAVLSGVPAFWLLRRTWLAGVEGARPTIATVGPVVLAVASAAAVGALVAGRRPRHPVGWLLLGVALSVSFNVLVEPYVKYGLVVRPGSLPGAFYLMPFVYSSFLVGLACAGFVLLLTPTGSLPSPRWRWWAGLVVAAAVATAVLHTQPLDPPYQAVAVHFLVQDGPLAAVATLGTVITLLGLLVAAGSLVVRFRRARGIERLQLRWVSMAAALAGLAVAVILVTWATIGSAAQPLWEWVTGAYLVALPLATGASILRYRLYDLDRIISRTVAYALLTVLLGLAYAAVALVLGRLLGRDSSLAVAGATLAVAATFQPARRRVQAAVDRRFNRRRHDAARIIAAFGTRLRDQVDLDVLHTELLAVVDQTMQPTRASLWLRPHAPSSTVGRPVPGR